jgi:hypothetical protein
MDEVALQYIEEGDALYKIKIAVVPYNHQYPVKVI